MLYLYVITLLKSSKPVNNFFLACIPMFLIRIYLDWTNDGSCSLTEFSKSTSLPVFIA